MADPDVVESKLNFLREYLSDLEEYKDISLEDYRKSKKDQRFIERTLHLACESCLDMAAHIISRGAMREPKDNKDLFAILFENRIISEITLNTMTKMAKFRNIIVHDYARIDPEIVIGILQRNLDELKRFGQEVIVYLQSNPG